MGGEIVSDRTRRQAGRQADVWKEDWTSSTLEYIADAGVRPPSCIFILLPVRVRVLYCE